ncbi:MAG: hypothetical protein EAZ51_07490 [Sphingobacteriales bacterium]|nr:MAG: hypothetical protein EAZ64_03630 [Sphingobacteriales bacterium]TAF79659.1 MAG: hypothetical protein EAZ51_07490 [Sphingobacteriales bacterium]
MRKNIALIIVLLFIVGVATRLYFNKISLSNNNSVKILNTIPSNAALVFGYKNEAPFYQIFKKFSLFSDVLGTHNFNQLTQLKNSLIDDAQLYECIDKSDLFFSLHKTGNHKADILLLAPLSPTFLSQYGINGYIQLINAKYPVKVSSFNKLNIYTIKFSKNQLFYFSFLQSILVGSYNLNLLQSTIGPTEKNSFKANQLFAETDRNKNAIAKLYLSFAKLPDFFNNFSKYKNPEFTAELKNFKAYASLNINYQSDAFMFNGITKLDTTTMQYAQIFLHQQPGMLTLHRNVPLNASSYTSFYVSDMPTFQTDVKHMFSKLNELKKLKLQINAIAQKHTIPIEQEFLKVLGKEFGQTQLASGHKLGLISTHNTKRLSFLLSTISTPLNDKIARFDDTNFIYYFLGEPFKIFARPYFTIVNNCLVVANSVSALQNFLTQYQQQKLISTTANYNKFEQYLPNKGNIFYFLHNKNSKAIFKDFLSKNAYHYLKSEQFKIENIYGLSIQFSADKNKFYTNLYLNKLNPTLKSTNLTDSLYIDSLTKQNK